MGRVCTWIISDSYMTHIWYTFAVVIAVQYTINLVPPILRFTLPNLAQQSKQFTITSWWYPLKRTWVSIPWYSGDGWYIGNVDNYEGDLREVVVCCRNVRNICAWFTDSKYCAFPQSYRQQILRISPKLQLPIYDIGIWGYPLVILQASRDRNAAFHFTFDHMFWECFGMSGPCVLIPLLDLV